MSPYVVIEDVGDRDVVGRVARCPGGSAEREGRYVEVGKALELLVEEVEVDGQDSTQRGTEAVKDVLFPGQVK